MIPVLLYPGFDPVLIQVAPTATRWSPPAYIGSLVIGWRIMRRLARLSPPIATEQQVDDFLTWATLGVVLGGRLGYVLFYQPGHYLTHPIEALSVWQGGMSFHGGTLGVIVALILYCRNRGIPRFGGAAWSPGGARGGCSPPPPFPPAPAPPPPPPSPPASPSSSRSASASAESPISSTANSGAARPPPRCPGP